MEAGGGEVHFMYTPVHGGGISANAYADTIAKSHLSEEASRPEVEAHGLVLSTVKSTCASRMVLRSTRG
eukprot:5654989-Prymnesium_polylepis.1